MRKEELQEDSTYYPNVFEAEIGGYPGPFFYVAWENGALMYWANRHENGTALIIRPKEDEWKLFWNVMEKIGLWEWKESYCDPNVIDGTSWGIHIEYGKRTIKSSGSNAYPGTSAHSDSKVFKRFCREVSRLLDGKDFY